ncbi:MAG TPA: thioredoxin domain-containing protein [Xanthomonadaceae bacterium]|nr:thioredoxin domain-containing protein [Xanthomonadaceae bacterium]
MPNALATEASLYLRQHADNPVDWQPWGTTALERARVEGKPILLSIGYASCHWCHVMAHESFEDADTASVMNALYVCIKVDREERPDLDRVYQLAHQALARRGGGWPLTVFLDPEDLTPFFAGTYFPREPRYGMPAFADVLRGAHQWWLDHRDEARAQGASLAAFLEELNSGAGAVPGIDAVDEALRRLAHGFDHTHGGFFGAPKFPQHGALELLLAHAGRDADGAAMLRRSLAAMAAGGLQDHLGGGFFRYSVDAAWQIPHFEKMLYDNAQLLPLYAQAAVRFDTTDFAAVARATADFLERDMRLPGGAFASALDADTAGEEGQTYVWTPDEVEALLPADQARLVMARYGLDRPANFEGRHWHLAVAASLEDAWQAAGLSGKDVASRLETARRTLLDARRQRPQPQRDDKILTAWNALAIAGLARAGRALGDEAMLESAARVLEALRRDCFDGDRLYVTAHRVQPAFLDDHAYLLMALLEMLATRFRETDLALAVQVADRLLEQFEDKDGGFFLTAHDQEQLFHRPKPFLDESLPSGNGIAARALLRLGHLLGEPRYLRAAERALAAASEVLRRQPHACATLVQALAEHHQPPTQTVVRLDAGDAATWTEALRRASQEGPLYRLPPDGDLPGVLGSVPAGAAIVCRGTQCSAPLRSPEALLDRLA